MFKQKFNSKEVFFTSDLHFDHKNIIKYCNRPFENVEEMNLKIIDNWNKIVPKDGIVFNLGDITFNINKSRDLINQLNGKMIFVCGNHDSIETGTYIKSKNGIFTDLAEITVSDEDGDQKIVLCHYPFLEWNGKFHGSWHLYGHVHSLSHNNNNASLDVGVDGHNMTPWTYEEVKIQITKQLLYEKH